MSINTFKRISIFLIVMLLPQFVDAQESLKGKVMDANHNPLPFASIGYFSHRVGANSDSLGEFIIPKLVADSLKVSSIGYHSQTFFINQQMHTLTVLLQLKNIELSDVTITNSKRRKTSYTIVLGHYRSKNNFASGAGDNFQTAVFIPNEQHIVGYIDAVKFKLEEIKNTNYNLRIRLLTADTVTGLPGEDLLLSDNFIPAGHLRHRNTFNVRTKNIMLPEAGVFVSFEYLPVDSRCAGTPMPFFAGNTGADKNYIFWNFNDTKWQVFNSQCSSGKFCVPNVGVVVSY
jgi:hypothetical protein